MAHRSKVKVKVRHLLILLVTLVIAMPLFSRDSLTDNLVDCNVTTINASKGVVDMFFRMFRFHFSKTAGNYQSYRFKPCIGAVPSGVDFQLRPSCQLIVAAIAVPHLINLIQVRAVLRLPSLPRIRIEICHLWHKLCVHVA